MNRLTLMKGIFLRLNSNSAAGYPLRFNLYVQTLVDYFSLEQRIAIQSAVALDALQQLKMASVMRTKVSLHPAFMPVIWLRTSVEVQEYVLCPTPDGAISLPSFIAPRAQAKILDNGRNNSGDGAQSEILVDARRAARFVRNIVPCFRSGIALGIALGAFAVQHMISIFVPFVVLFTAGCSASIGMSELAVLSQLRDMGAEA